jgi:hypothetical protein
MAGAMRAFDPRRFASSILALVLSTAVALAGAERAFASGQGSSGSGSGGDSSNSKDSNSSNGSKDSSNASGDSSDNSRGSSKDSNESTQHSPENTSEYTTHHSSDWTTKTRDGHVFLVAVVLVSVGATAVGVALGNATQRKNQQQIAAALAETMRRQHPLLTHDLATGKGPVLDAWAHDLRLDAVERRRLAAALEGSAEQGLLLGALDGPIDDARARRFGAAFLRLTERALGKARTRGLVERALRATGAG